MSSDPLPLIPAPLKCDRLDQPAFTLSAGTAINAPAVFAATAQFLAGRLATATSWTLPRDQAAAASRIEFVTAEALPAEGYTLRVTTGVATITAASPAGAFYGVQTLLQLFPPAVFDTQPRPDLKWTGPCVEIKDAPRFRWRGVMVDSARHFQPVGCLKKFIDVLAQHKINVFHWHLVDDQGWRIEIKKYPRLTTVGGSRRETVRGWSPHGFTGDGVPVEGFYTQDEIRDLVAYAAARHVNILPEIEMPGHAQAAIAAYPEFGLLPDAKPVSCTWGIHETLFSTEPATFAFLEDVLAEVVALFPFEYVHIGGDEAIKPQWENDPATQARIKELGLKDEHELQSWFIRRAEAILQKLNRRLVGWDEILEGGLADTATVMSWRGIEGAVAAARHGNDAVMCASQFLYFNFHETDALETEPLTYQFSLPLERVHGYEPIPAELTAGQAGHVIGVQAQLWTEYIPTPSRLEYMAFPRVCALAEIARCPKDRPGFAHFLTRLKTHLRRLDVQDVRYRAPLEYLRA